MERDQKDLVAYQLSFILSFLSPPFPLGSSCPQHPDFLSDPTYPKHVPVNTLPSYLYAVPSDRN